MDTYAYTEMFTSKGKRPHLHKHRQSSIKPLPAQAAWENAPEEIFTIYP